MKVYVSAVLALTGVFSSPFAAAQTNCAPPSLFGSAPSGTIGSICFSSVDPIPGTLVDSGLGLWRTNCGDIGASIPALVGPGGGGTCSTSSIYVEVNYDPAPHPQGYDAVANLQPGNPGSPITGATITCHVSLCSAELLAHEVGHVFALGDATDAACDNTIMDPTPPGSRNSYSAACGQASTDWRGPADGDASPPPTSDICEWDPSDVRCSPILINLGVGPYRLSGVDDPVSFDLNADGHLDRITWTARAAALAFLALDRNTNGRVDNGSELFGNATPLASGERAPNGFEALKEFDINVDGLVDQQDTGWGSLLLWIDANHDGISQPAELSSITHSPIVAIETDYHWTGRRDSSGNFFRYESLMHLRRGKRPVYDVYFHSVP
jgi:hypothetical protein